jgi:hypothetical protein
LNYQSKTIGVVMEFKRRVVFVKEGFVKECDILPCLPSAVIPAYVVYMDDPTIWCDYRTTLLRFRVKARERREILCSITCKVVDDGIVVGF